MDETLKIGVLCSFWFFLSEYNDVCCWKTACTEKILTNRLRCHLLHPHRPRGRGLLRCLRPHRLCRGPSLRVECRHHLHHPAGCGCRRRGRQRPAPGRLLRPHRGHAPDGRAQAGGEVTTGLTLRPPLPPSEGEHPSPASRRARAAFVGSLFHSAPTGRYSGFHPPPLRPLLQGRCSQPPPGRPA